MDARRDDLGVDVFNGNSAQVQLSTNFKTIWFKTFREIRPGKSACHDKKRVWK